MRIMTYKEIQDLINSGWSKDEIYGKAYFEAKQENPDLSFNPEQERQIRLYNIYRNENPPPPPATEKENYAEQIVSLYEEQQGDEPLTQFAKVVGNPLFHSVAALKLMMDPKNKYAKRLYDATSISGRDPNKDSQMMQGAKSNIVTLKNAGVGISRLLGGLFFGKEGEKMAEGLINQENNEYLKKSDYLYQAWKDANRTEEEKKRREQLSRDYEKSSFFVNPLDTLGVGLQIAGGEIYDLLSGNAKYTREFANFFLDPTIIAPFGAGKASKFLTQSAMRGALYGGAFTGGVAGLASYGETGDANEAIKSGIVGFGIGAGIGAPTGALGYGVGKAFAPSVLQQRGRTPESARPNEAGGEAGRDDIDALIGALKSDTQKRKNVTQAPASPAEAVANIESQEVARPDSTQETIEEPTQETIQEPSQEITPEGLVAQMEATIGKIKQELSDTENKPDEAIMQSALHNLSLNEETSKEIIQSSILETMEEVANIQNRTAQIAELAEEKAKMGKTPEVEPDPVLQEVTKKINGNSVTDARYDALGWVNVVSNEIQAIRAGKSKRTPEQIGAILKRKGLSDEFIQASVESVQMLNIKPMFDVAESAYSNVIRNEALQKLQSRLSKVEPFQTGNRVLGSEILADDKAGFGKLPLQYELVPKSSVVEDFTGNQGTQFRLQNNAKSIEAIANNFDPDIANMGGFDGAPIVAPNGLVVAGNHRVAGIKEMNPSSREKYEEWIQQRFGEDVFEGVENKDDYMVVRRLLSDDDNLIRQVAQYSNTMRLKGVGERMIANHARLEENIKALLNERGQPTRTFKNEQEMMGLLGANTAEEASGAILYSLNPKLAEAFEILNSQKKNDDMLRLNDVLISNAYRFWNLKYIQNAKTQSFKSLITNETMFAEFTSDLTPYLDIAIREMVTTEGKTKKEFQAIIDLWYQSVVPPEKQIEASGLGIYRFGVHRSDLFIGDILGALLNKMSSLTDKGFTRIGDRLDALYDAINQYETGLLDIEDYRFDIFDSLAYLIEANSHFTHDSQMKFNLIADEFRKKPIIVSELSGGKNDSIRDNLEGMGDRNDAIPATAEGSIRESSPRAEQGGLGDVGEVWEPAPEYPPATTGDLLPSEGILGERIEDNPADNSGSTAPTDSEGRSSTLSKRQQELSDTRRSIDRAVGGLADDNKDAVSGVSDDIQSQDNGGDYGINEETRDTIDSTHSSQATAISNTKSDTRTGAELAKPEPIIDASTAERARLQKRANVEYANRPPIPANLENIAQDLPILLEEQMKDVALVEKAYSGGKKGVLLTNGTGTGKTFIGLGVLKRQIKQGKKDILIVAPSDGVIKNWIREGKEVFDIDIYRIPDTKTAPEGLIAITSYAAFRANKPLKNKVFDFIIYDESHNLLENKEGGEGATLAAHRAITRLNYAGLKRNTNEDKILFLSATPFNAAPTLDYVNGILFPYQPIDKLLTNYFGYRINKGKLVPDDKVDIGERERAFANSLMADGVMSGRRLVTKTDYGFQMMRVNDEQGIRIQKMIDYAASMAGNDRDFLALYQYLNRALFDFIGVNRFSESAKAIAIVPIIREAIEKGHKIVIAHSYISDNPPRGDIISNPAPIISSVEKKLGFKADEIQRGFQKLHETYPDSMIPFEFYDPITYLQNEFKEQLVAYNGKVNANAREKMVADFNDPDSKVKIIMIQNQAGGVGISLHDKIGTNPRILIDIAIPVRPILQQQTHGRVHRIGGESNTAIITAITGTGQEMRFLAFTNPKRQNSVDNLANGDAAQNRLRLYQQLYTRALETPLEYKNITFEGGVDLLTKLDQRSTFENTIAEYWEFEANREFDEANFQTPSPIAESMVNMASIHYADTILEPSAGAGNLIKFFPQASKVIAVEPNIQLNKLLSFKIDISKVKNQNFENLHGSNSASVIVMTPPFSQGGAIAKTHLQKALTLLQSDGRIVAFVPQTEGIQTLINNLPVDTKLVMQIKLPKIIGERPSEIIIIDRTFDETPPAVIDLSKNRDYLLHENINEVFKEVYEISQDPSLKRAFDENVLKVESPIEKQAKKINIIETDNPNKVIISYDGYLKKDVWKQIYSKVKEFNGAWRQESKGFEVPSDKQDIIREMIEEFCR